MRRTRPLIDRFKEKTRVVEDGCWIFLGPVDKQGYARIYANGEKQLAHRVAYELFVGPIPEGLQVDHVRARGCTSRACVNPSHLEAVTALENTMRAPLSRGTINAAKTHCDAGHLFDLDNTRFVPRARGRVQRACRKCDARRARDYRARVAA